MNGSTVLDVASATFLLLGCLLTLLAAVGLLRLSDVLARLHTAAKPQVLGVLLALLGVGLRLTDDADVAMLVAIGVFQLLTVPVAAQLVGRAAYRSGQVDVSQIDADDLADRLAEEEHDRGHTGA